MKKFLDYLENITGLDIKIILNSILIVVITLPLVGFIVNFNNKNINKQISTKVEATSDLEQKTLGINTNINSENIKTNLINFEEEQKKNDAFYESIISSYEFVNIYPTGQITPTSLISVCMDQNKNQELCDKEISRLAKTITTAGKIEDAYIYIKVGVNRGSSTFHGLTYYDSIYFLIDDGSRFGGHLLRAEATWKRENEDSTELMFNLKKIPFTTIPYPTNQAVTPIKEPNLLDQINIPGDHFVVSFVSTLGMGKIYELKVGYKGGQIVLK